MQIEVTPSVVVRREPEDADVTLCVGATEWVLTKSEAKGLAHALEAVAWPSPADRPATVVHQCGGSEQAPGRAACGAEYTPEPGAIVTCAACFEAMARG